MTPQFDVYLALAYACLLAISGALLTRLLPLAATVACGRLRAARLRLRARISDAASRPPMHLPEVRVRPLFGAPVPTRRCGHSQ